MTDLIEEPDTSAPGSERHHVACPSCGADNPARNQFCEHCGWRLAAEVPRRTRVGWIGWTGAAALIAALVWVAFGRSEPPEATLDITNPKDAGPSVVTPAVEATVDQIAPISVAASSELEGFEAYHLVDADLETAWNDASLRGRGAELVFTFAPAATLTEVVLHMPVDEESFFLNARPRGVEISFEDSAEVVITELSDEPGPHRVALPSVTTTQLVLRVTSIYDAIPFGGHEPYDELSVAEVTFRGTVPADSFRSQGG